MLIDEIYCVGTTYAIFVALRQAAPFIAQTLIPDQAVWSFQQAIDCVFRTIRPINMISSVVPYMLSQ